MKHSGGSLMMWGCMTALGPGYACKIEDKTLNSEGYTKTGILNILQYIPPSGWKVKGIVLCVSGHRTVLI
ncbi:MAG: hypothetical protein EXX96DRAFT_582903 [Benjaminiella poitrasii]|nr:MAG: hypothetical protein EXX96DRAFT_582903 [Benjaminiella poitrasii]